MALWRPLMALAICALALTTAWCAHGASLESPPFTIHFEDVDRAVVEQSLTELEGAAARLDDRLPVGTDPVTIYLCGSAAEFMERAGPYGRVDIGGIARSEEGIIIMKAPHLLTQPGEYKGILRHELVHVLLARNVNTDALPRWLNEGLAMRLAGEHRWSSWMTIGDMYLNGRLIAYRDLMIVLNSPGEMAFGDAYAQSLSMTAFLFRQVGDEAFWEMMAALETQSFGQALENQTGWTPYEFWVAWKRSLWTYALAFSVLSGFSIFQFGAILLVWGYYRKRRKTQIILDRMEEEEEDELMPWEVFDTEGPYDWEEKYRDRY